MQLRLDLVLTLIGIAVTASQLWNAYQIAQLRKDLAALWKRANNHDHYVVCDTGSCKPITNGVIIHE